MGPKRAVLGVGAGSKTVLGSTHVDKLLLISMFPSIQTFGLDSVLVSFWHFGALMGYFWGLGRVSKTVFWVSSCR